MLIYTMYVTYYVLLNSKTISLTKLKILPNRLRLRMYIE